MKDKKKRKTKLSFMSTQYKIKGKKEKSIEFALKKFDEATDPVNGLSDPGGGF